MESALATDQYELELIQVLDILSLMCRTKKVLPRSIIIGQLLRAALEVEFNNFGKTPPPPSFSGFKDGGKKHFIPRIIPSAVRSA